MWTKYAADGTPVGLDSSSAAPRTTYSAFSGGPPANPQLNDTWIGLGPQGIAAAWQFIYRPEYSGTNDWLFIGGAPYKIADGGQVSTTNTTFIAIDGTTPTFTIQRTGEYNFIFGARMGAYNAEAADIGLFADNTLFAYNSIYNPDTGGAFHAGATMSETYGVSAGQVIQLRYRGNFGNLIWAHMRYIVTIPVRVS